MTPPKRTGSERPGRASFAGRARGLVPRLLVFGAIWWAMTEGGLHHPGTALLIVAASALSSLALVPPGTWPIRPSALPRFIPYFLHQSLLGGLDVAIRALKPRMDLSTRIVEYPLELEGEPARVFFAWVVSLLPGTASVELDDRGARIHVLDDRQPHAERLGVLERHVGRLFREQA
jgi:multicomponent Na+:H+ antiporter subunit E